MYAADPYKLSKGDIAPVDGLLFDIEKANDLRVKVLERDSYKLLNESLTKSLDIARQNFSLSEEKSQVLVEQNLKLSKSLQDQISLNNYERIFWFALGAVLTGAAAYGVTKTIK